MSCQYSATIICILQSWLRDDSVLQKYKIEMLFIYCFSVNSQRISIKFLFLIFFIYIWKIYEKECDTGRMRVYVYAKIKILQGTSGFFWFLRRFIEFIKPDENEFDMKKLDVETGNSF